MPQIKVEIMIRYLSRVFTLIFFHDIQDWVASQPSFSLQTGSQLMKEHSIFGAEYLPKERLPPQEHCGELIL